MEPISANEPREHDDETEQPSKLQRGVFRCQPCQVDFSTKRSVQRHFRESKAHATGPSDYFCYSCNKPFTRAFDLKRHETEVHGKSRRQTARALGVLSFGAHTDSQPVGAEKPKAIGDESTVQEAEKPLDGALQEATEPATHSTWQDAEKVLRRASDSDGVAPASGLSVENYSNPGKPRCGNAWTPQGLATIFEDSEKPPGNPISELKGGATEEVTDSSLLNAGADDPDVLLAESQGKITLQQATV